MIWEIAFIDIVVLIVAYLVVVLLYAKNVHMFFFHLG